MNSLYLWLNICSISIPFLYSFHPRLQLYKSFKWLFLSLILTMGVFIPWDVIFTVNGIWGFNPNYFLGVKIFSLPFEEWQLGSSQHLHHRILCKIRPQNPQLYFLSQQQYNYLNLRDNKVLSF